MSAWTICVGALLLFMLSACGHRGTTALDPPTQTATAVYTGDYFSGRYLYGPNGYTGYWLSENRINGPSGYTGFWVSEKYLNGPHGYTAYWVIDRHIYGPTQSLPWL